MWGTWQTLSCRQKSSATSAASSTTFPTLDHLNSLLESTWYVLLSLLRAMEFIHSSCAFLTPFQKYYANSKIPVLIVGNKSELPAVRQDYILQPDVFCNRHKVGFLFSSQLRILIFLHLEYKTGKLSFPFHCSSPLLNRSQPLAVQRKTSLSNWPPWLPFRKL